MNSKEIHSVQEPTVSGDLENRCRNVACTYSRWCCSHSIEILNILKLKINNRTFQNQSRQSERIFLQLNIKGNILVFSMFNRQNSSRDLQEVRKVAAQLHFQDDYRHSLLIMPSNHEFAIKQLRKNRNRTATSSTRNSSIISSTSTAAPCCCSTMTAAMVSRIAVT